ncbi:unnamed protein product [[Candida] boidinii]|nr:unnamed protein product [[Candida] boidinii]
MTPKSMAKNSVIDSPSFIQEEVEEEEEEEEEEVEKEELALRTDSNNLQDAEMSLIVPKGRKAPKRRVTSRQLTFSSDLEEEEEDTIKHLNGEQEITVAKEDRTIFNSVIPSTPKGKIVTEEMARKWHNDSYFKEEGTHDNHDDYYSPFVKSKSNALNYKENKNNSIFDGNKKKTDFSRYENEVEYIDKRTGEKIFVPMEDFQKSIKPKRLVFFNNNSNTTISESPSSVPSTPKRQIKEKVLKKLNIKSLMDKQMASDESSYNDDEYYQDEDSELKKNDDISGDEIIKKGDFKSIFNNAPKRSLPDFQKDETLEHTITYINHQTGAKTMMKILMNSRALN